MINTKLILTFLASLSVAIFIAPVCFGETQDWKKELARELVSFKGGKMIIETYELCKIGSSNLQVKTYSEAPRDGLISRDNFVAITVTSAWTYLSALGDTECKDIDRPIGNVDLELAIHMTKEGMKQDFKDHRTNARQSQTVLWSELFAD